ncbi:30S ribosomal protein S10 [Patescibacteria group bacterium]|nr:30S ribosomal protein S10 [Patescibacteria group bacterium]
MKNKSKQKDKIVAKKLDKKEYKPKIRIKVKSYDHRIIDEAIKNIIESLKHLDAKIIGPIFLPTEKRKYTVLRSSFVHKDSRDQYEKRTHKRLIDIIDFNPKVIEKLTGLDLPAGVDIEIKM